MWHIVCEAALRLVISFAFWWCSYNSLCYEWNSPWARSKNIPF